MNEFTNYNTQTAAADYGALESNKAPVGDQAFGKGGHSMELNNCQKPGFEDLTALGKTIVIALTVLQIALFTAALLDIRRRPAEEIKGKKWWWVCGSFVNFAGPIAYFLFGQKTRY